LRIKRTFECKNCNKVYHKWQGFCSCGKPGSLTETTLNLTISKETAAAKRIRVRSKNTERKIAKVMALGDGEDPTYKNVASKNGRVGFITGMRIDTVSKNYIVEAKNRVLPKWLLDAWILLQQRKVDFNKNILLYIEPPNLPKEFRINGVLQKTSSLHVITQERHLELIQKERELEELKNYTK
jgi:hypothetical protein